MSAGTAPPFPDAASLRRGRFAYFPVAPGRMEFALEVRQAILRERPQTIALELPASLQPVWMRAIKLKSLATERAHETGALETAILETLGEEALRYAGRNRTA